MESIDVELVTHSAHSRTGGMTHRCARTHLLRTPPGEASNYYLSFGSRAAEIAENPVQLRFRSGSPTGSTLFSKLCAFLHCERTQTACHAACNINPLLCLILIAVIRLPIYERSPQGRRPKFGQSFHPAGIVSVRDLSSWLMIALTLFNPGLVVMTCCVGFLNV